MKTNVRVVAATNVNLLDAVNNGKFREDLYYRLNTVPIYVPPLRDRGEDVLLLFRKFTNDFSERYRTKPVRLDGGARDLLIQYSFPGNIRQLKNIAEQITILETDKELPISLETLNHYLNPVQPSSRRALVPLRSGDDNGTSFSERELLYKVLFDMRRDMTELKKLVRNVLENEKHGGDILKDHQELFSSLNTVEPVITNPAIEPPRFLTQPSSRNVDLDRYSGERDEIEDVVHVTAEEESLSLEDKEKEMIIKALRKNNNKRKYAANALGISERTLYRKIKQYDIEE
jgi:DNA-binding NtrC family response regulator